MATDNFRDVPGDLKDNYLDLHQSTGESFASIADRVEHPHVLGFQDEAGQKSAKRLAEWLRTQTDDQEVKARFAAPEHPANEPPPSGDVAALTARVDSLAGLVETLVGALAGNNSETSKRPGRSGA